jgi:nucleoside-diphosphate-sugar epimerase
MKVAVIGGAGVVGQALLPRLAEDGHQIRALRHRTPLPPGVASQVQGSLTDPEAVRDVVQGAEVVLHMTKGGEGVAQVVEISTWGTLNVLDVIRETPSVRQYLLTSSDAATAIWFHPHGNPIDHTTPPQSYPGYYSLGKVLEEVIVHEYDRNGGVPYTIARLSMVVQEDSVLGMFIRGEGDERHIACACDTSGTPLRRTIVQRADVVSGLLAMLGNERALGETFHLSGPAFSFEEAARYLAEKTGLPVRPVEAPDAHSFDIDTSHTTERLGWTPQYDVAAAIQAALECREASA